MERRASIAIPLKLCLSRARHRDRRQGRRAPRHLRFGNDLLDFAEL